MENGELKGLAKVIDFNKDKKQVQFYIEREIYPKLYDRAQKQGLTVSGFCRWIMKKEVMKKEEKSEIENIKKRLQDLYDKIEK